MIDEETKIETKICNKCNTEKNITDFYVRRDKKLKKTIPRHVCKICFNEKYKLTYVKIPRKKKPSKLTPININITTKLCNICNVEKDVCNFYHSKKENAYREKCKSCRKIERSVYLNENKEIRSIKEKNKRINDPGWAIRKNISTNINKHLKNRGGSKNGESILKYLYYTTEHLKSHLESQWEDWMNWDNYGVYKFGDERKWHIDHIIPQNLLSFNTMNCITFLQCWSLQNLRPLCAVENVKKQDNISEDLFNKTMLKINLELEMQADINFDFKIKLENFKLEQVFNNLKQLKKVG